MYGRKATPILLCLSLMTVIAACGGAATEDKIYDHLEEAVSAEDGFEKQQDPIVELEQKEQSLYAKIIDLGMEDLDQIKELSQEAMTTIDERSDKIAQEKESMDASKKEFEKINTLTGELDEGEEKNKAGKMYDTMMKRYEAYNTLHSSYKESLELEKELYTMLPDEETKQDDLTEHISKINDSYQNVLEANKEFNTYTQEYNERKKKFYEAADLEVDYKEEPSNDQKNGSNEEKES